MIKLFSLTIFCFITMMTLHAQEIVQLGANDVYDFRFSPKGFQAYLTNGNAVDIWNIHEKKLIATLENGPDHTILAIDISSDSAFLVASSIDSVISVWNLATYALIKKVKINCIANTVIFGHDNSMVFAGLRNGEVLSVNSFTGDINFRKESGMTEVTSMALSDSLGYLAVSGSKGMLQLWNSSMFTILDQKKAHADFVRGLIFNNINGYLYSCGDDGKVNCFNLKNKILTKHLLVHGDIKKPWTMSVDYMDPQVVAYATLRGNIYIDNYPRQYFYHLSGKVFKLHFLPQSNKYIVVGVATSDGLKIIWASKMNSKNL